MTARQLAERLIGICDGSQKDPIVQIAVSVGGCSDYWDVGDVDTCIELDDSEQGSVQIVPFRGGEFDCDAADTDTPGTTTRA